MDKRVSLRIASIVLLIHGLMEILGALILLFTYNEFLPIGSEGNVIFWASLSIIYGVSRLIAGYATWIMKKWGIAFSITLSITTMIIASSIIPFGIMDSILAIIVLVTTLYAWFEDKD